MSAMSDKNPYEVLGVTPGAEDAVVEAAYQALVKEYHPDHGGDSDTFQEIKEAYDLIQSDQNVDQDISNSYTPQATRDTESFFNLFNTPIDTEAVAGQLSDSLVLEGDKLTVALTNIFRGDITDYVYLDRDNIENRLLISLHVENTSDYVQKFEPYKIRIITESGARYDGETGYLGQGEYDINGDTKTLPSQMHATKRKMEPHTNADYVAVIEPIPETADIDRVIYPFKLFAGHQTDGVVQAKTRFVFDIQPEHWQEFDLVADGMLQVPSKKGTDSIGEIPAANSEIRRESENEHSHSGSSPDIASQPETEKTPALSETDADRIADIVALEPTTNSELKEQWNMDSGSEVHQYLENKLADYYERNESKKIVSTTDARRLTDTMKEYED